MYRNPLFILWSSVLLLVAVLHIIAIEFYLYWFYSWFDSMMHFLGGLFVGLSALWFFFTSGYTQLSLRVRNIVLVAGFSIILIGIGWEIFEILAGIPREDNFITDTITDLTMDALGTSIAVIIFTKLFMNKNKEKYER